METTKDAHANSQADVINIFTECIIIQIKNNLNRIKLKALRDEFLMQQEKINRINHKIKDLSLFKLEIEGDLREYSRKYIEKVNIY